MIENFISSLDGVVFLSHIHQLHPEIFLETISRGGGGMIDF